MTVADFFASAAAAIPGLVGPYKVKRIGTDADIFERLMTLILSDQKTGTFNLPWLHGHHPETIPEADARDAKVWGDIHWPYWTKQLSRYGLRPLPDMPVCVERFTLLTPVPAR